MDKILLALAPVFFALSAFGSFYAEYRRPDESEIANRLATQKYPEALEAGQIKAEQIEEEAKKQKRRERMLWFFIPWVIGMFLSGAGLYFLSTN